MLKSLCGGVYAGVLTFPIGGDRTWLPPAKWLEYLYSGEPLPPPLGMYATFKAGDLLDPNRQVELACIANGSDVYGLIVGFHGFKFILSMVVPVDPLFRDTLLFGASYRPSVLSFIDSQRAILIDWGVDHKGSEFGINSVAAPPQH